MNPWKDIFSVLAGGHAASVNTLGSRDLVNIMDWRGGGAPVTTHACAVSRKRNLQPCRVQSMQLFVTDSLCSLFARVLHVFCIIVTPLFTHSVFLISPGQVLAGNL